jgi:hypothetical protein
MPASGGATAAWGTQPPVPLSAVVDTAPHCSGAAGARTAVPPGACAPGPVVGMPPRLAVLALTRGTRQETRVPPQRLEGGVTWVDVAAGVDGRAHWDGGASVPVHGPPPHAVSGGEGLTGVSYFESGGSHDESALCLQASGVGVASPPRGAPALRRSCGVLQSWHGSCLRGAGGGPAAVTSGIRRTTREC